MKVKPIIGIFGCGRVGTAVAFSIIHQNLASKLLLVGSRLDYTKAEKDDLTHSLSFLPHRPKILTGTREDLKICDIIVICARASSLGSAYLNGGTRDLELLSNHQMVMDLIPYLSRGCKLIVVSNPVDIITSLFAQYSILPKSHIIGVGTLLDTSRYSQLLAEKHGVELSDVDALVIGTHDSYMIPLWGQAQIKNWRVSYDAEIEHRTTTWGPEIAKAKGSTWWGIATGIVQMIDSLSGEQQILTVSTYDALEGVAYSLPTLIGEGGAEKVYRPELDSRTQLRLKSSLLQVRNRLDSLSESTRSLSTAN